MILLRKLNRYRSLAEEKQSPLCWFHFQQLRTCPCQTGRKMYTLTFVREENDKIYDISFHQVVQNVVTVEIFNNTLF